MPVVVWGCMGPQAGHNGFCSLHALPAVNEGMLIKRSNVFWPLVYRPLQCAGRLLCTRTSNLPRDGPQAPIHACYFNGQSEYEICSYNLGS